VEVLSLVSKAPKTGGDSLNYVPRFKIIAKGKPQDGMELNHTFNSQAIGRMAPFIAAILERPLKEISEGLAGNNLEFDTDDAVGKKLQIQIANEPYDGRMVNRVVNFAAYGSAPAF
jgi:hypothetical protein